MMLSTLLRIAQFETTISIPELLNGNSTLVRITHDGIVGRVRAFLPFVVAFGSDAGAYFCGRAFGKKQLAPAISPHKTVAGGIGGAVCGAAMALLYGVIVRACGLSANLVSFAAFGLVGSVVAQLGDLTFSAFKRQYGIKDYGNILPVTAACSTGLTVCTISRRSRSCGCCSCPRFRHKDGSFYGESNFHFRLHRLHRTADCSGSRPSWYSRARARGASGCGPARGAGGGSSARSISP